MFLNQIMHMPKAQLNTFNYAYPGESSVGGDPSDLSRFLGQVGRFVYAQSNSTQLKFDSSVGTLYGGIYQLVKVVASPAVAILRGHVAYWSNPLTFTVDTKAGADGDHAGIFLNPVTGGNYTFIQVAGIVDVLFLDNITHATGPVGSTVVTAANSRTDILADATAVIFGNSKLILGTNVQAAVNGTNPRYRVLLFPRNVF